MARALSQHDRDTYRDEFAGRAMEGIITAIVANAGIRGIKLPSGLPEEVMLRIARRAYDMADVMLRIRDLNAD